MSTKIVSFVDQSTMEVVHQERDTQTGVVVSKYRESMQARAQNSLQQSSQNQANWAYANMQNYASAQNYAQQWSLRADSSTQNIVIGLTSASTLLTTSTPFLFSTKRRSSLVASKAFALVKRCLGKNSADKLRSKISNAASLAKQAKNNGQQALYEEMTAKIADDLISCDLAEAGFATYINRASVEKFAGRTDGELHVTALENFGRPIPAEVSEKLKRAKDSGLFKGFTVLHAGAAMIKTAAQKIREKDPILFGVVEKQPNRLYYIADWIDELCHLTLSELIVDPNFTGSLEQVEIDREAIHAEVAMRDSLLATTSPRNWRDNEAKAKNLQDGKKPWWKKLF